MSRIVYKEMNLFDAPAKSLLVHACNCQGVWGRGIAKDFREKFPLAYEGYKNSCNELFLLGRALVSIDRNYYIGCLMTSWHYSPPDAIPMILQNTERALESLHRHPTVYSNKFNSGLFGVPWEETEKILKNYLDRNRGISWTVCVQ